MALPLTADPNPLILPDYSLPILATSRQPLLDNGLDRQQAVAMLNSLWKAANDRDKLQWQVQLDASAAEGQHREQERETEKAAAAAQDKLDVEQARKASHQAHPYPSTSASRNPANSRGAICGETTGKR